MEGRRVEDISSIWEIKDVRLSVRLPRETSERARKFDEEDPKLLSNIVLYGLTRRSIYHELREVSEREESPLHSRGVDSKFYDDHISYEFIVSLPTDIAEQAEEVQKEDPGFLSLVLYYGVERQSIYRRLHDQSQIGRQRLIDFGMDPDNPG